MSYLLYQGFDDSTFEKVTKASTSKAAWDTLNTIFKGVDRVKRICLQSLRAEFESAHMNEGENISDYYSRLLVIVNEMKRNSKKLEDVRVMEKILRSLILKVEHMVMANEESKAFESLRAEELLGSLRVHEQRILKNAGSTSLKQALESKLDFDKPKEGRGQWNSRRGGVNYRGRGQGRGRCNTNDHGPSQERRNSSNWRK